MLVVFPAIDILLSFNNLSHIHDLIPLADF